MSKLIHYSGPAGSILLPQGYTRLAWVESDGTAVIDTGYAPIATTELYFEASGIGGHYIGSRTAFDGSGTQMYSFYAPNANTFRFDWLGYVNTVAINGIVHVLCKPKSVTVNGIVITRDITKKALSNTMYLFGTNGGGNCFAGTRFYKVTIWSNSSTLVRDFVPVKRTSDNAVGFLDLQHPEAGLYTCSGLTGSVEIPQGFPTSEYCQVEWLGNEKATGYVAIPYTHKADTWVDTELAFTTIYHYNTIFGACTADNSSDSFTFGCMSSDKLNCDLGTFYQANAGLVANTFYRFLVSSKTIIKDTTTYSPNKTTTTCDKTWALFTRHNNTSYTNEAGHGKFKYMKIYEGTFNNVSGSILKAHLIPCYRRSDMKPGFYDLVGRSFHEFVGPGASIGPSITFGYGEVINGAVGFPQTSAYDSNIYYEPDGSAWIRVFHHNNPASNKFSSSDTFTTSFKKNDNMWWDMPKFNQITDNIYDIMVKYKTTSNAGEIKHRWVQYTNPMSGTFEDTTYNKVTKSYYYGSTIMNNFYGGFYRDTSNNAYIVHNDNDRGNWFGAIGCWSSFQNGIPGPNGTIITSGYVDVYMHIPNHPAIPYNTSTGDGRNGEKNGAFDRGYIKTQGLESLKTSNWTIACWLYPLATSTIGSSAFLGLGSTFKGALIVESNRYFSYNSMAVGNLSLENNKWTHIAFVNNGNTIKYYKNGIYVNEIDSTNIADTGELWVGSRCFGGEVNCRFQDIQVWDEIKNPAELM